MTASRKYWAGTTGPIAFCVMAGIQSGQEAGSMERAFFLAWCDGWSMAECGEIAQSAATATQVDWHVPLPNVVQAPSFY